MPELDDVKNLPEILEALDGTPDESASKLAQLVHDGKIPIEEAKELYKSRMEGENSGRLAQALEPPDPLPQTPVKTHPESFPKSDFPGGPAETIPKVAKKQSPLKHPEIKVSRKVKVIGAGLTVVALLGVAGVAAWQRGVPSTENTNKIDSGTPTAEKPLPSTNSQTAGKTARPTPTTPNQTPKPETTAQDKNATACLSIVPGGSIYRAIETQNRQLGVTQNDQLKKFNLQLAKNLQKKYWEKTGRAVQPGRLCFTLTNGVVDIVSP